jgi:hypothetical protein
MVYLFLVVNSVNNKKSVRFRIHIYTHCNLSTECYGCSCSDVSISCEQYNNVQGQLTSLALCSTSKHPCFASAHFKHHINVTNTGLLLLKATRNGLPPFRCFLFAVCYANVVSIATEFFPWWCWVTSNLVIAAPRLLFLFSLDTFCHLIRSCWLQFYRHSKQTSLNSSMHFITNYLISSLLL